MPLCNPPKSNESVGSNDIIECGEICITWRSNSIKLIYKHWDLQAMLSIHCYYSLHIFPISIFLFLESNNYMITHSPDSWQTSLGLGNMCWYSPQILICVPNKNTVPFKQSLTLSSVKRRPFCPGEDELNLSKRSISFWLLLVSSFIHDLALLQDW